MKERHGEEDVTVVTQDAVMSSFSRILRTLTLAVAAIAAVSLGVAGIGIMNVMLVSVTERTAEVGLLRAVGAGQGQIARVFLAEAALLSAAGGVLGLAVGLAGVGVLVAMYPAAAGAAAALGRRERARARARRRRRSSGCCRRAAPPGSTRWRRSGGGDDGRPRASRGRRDC